jgi:hypothetical protein
MTYGRCAASATMSLVCVMGVYADVRLDAPDALSSIPLPLHPRDVRVAVGDAGVDVDVATVASAYGSYLESYERLYEARIAQWVAESAMALRGPMVMEANETTFEVLREFQSLRGAVSELDASLVDALAAGAAELWDGRSAMRVRGGMEKLRLLPELSGSLGHMSPLIVLDLSVLVNEIPEHEVTPEIETHLEQYVDEYLAKVRELHRRSIRCWDDLRDRLAAAGVVPGARVERVNEVRAACWREVEDSLRAAADEVADFQLRWLEILSSLLTVRDQILVRAWFMECAYSEAPQLPVERLLWAMLESRDDARAVEGLAFEVLAAHQPILRRITEELQRELYSRSMFDGARVLGQTEEFQRLIERLAASERQFEIRAEGIVGVTPHGRRRSMPPPPSTLLLVRRHDPSQVGAIRSPSIDPVELSDLLGVLEWPEHAEWEDVAAAIHDAYASRWAEGFREGSPFTGEYGLLSPAADLSSRSRVDEEVSALQSAIALVRKLDATLFDDCLLACSTEDERAKVQQARRMRDREVLMIPRRQRDAKGTGWDDLAWSIDHVCALTAAPVIAAQEIIARSEVVTNYEANLLALLERRLNHWYMWWRRQLESIAAERQMVELSKRRQSGESVDFAVLATAREELLLAQSELAEATESLREAEREIAELQADSLEEFAKSAGGEHRAIVEAALISNALAPAFTEGTIPLESGRALLDACRAELAIPTAAECIGRREPGLGERRMGELGPLAHRVRWMAWKLDIEMWLASAVSAESATELNTPDE